LITDRYLEVNHNELASVDGTGDFSAGLSLQSSGISTGSPPPPSLTGTLVYTRNLHHYQKQLKRGKEEMVVLGYCMSKVVHLIYGILKTGERFDPCCE